MHKKREYPFGAALLEDGVHFRVWAPKNEKVELIFKGKRYLLEKEAPGWFSLLLKEASAGDLYTYSLDNSKDLADPASYSQPQGIFGPSCIFDPKSYQWKDSKWKGTVSLKGQFIYEIHVGTFTPEGTWKSAMQKLPYLAELGITLIEMMPIAEFAGKFGWGYDGIFLFAPYSGYGTPYDLMAFIDKAHQLGMGVLLDVVYNHFGPHLDLHRHFSPYFFNSEHTTDWGSAINFDGEEAQTVRSFYVSNVLYLLEQFHFDGLRFDATQDIYDSSEKHILREIAENVHKKITQRDILLIAENEPQDSALITDYKLNALWNDDFHHSARVALVGKKEGYLSDYQGTPQELLSACKYGYLYQGQYYAWQKKMRGKPALQLNSEQFIIYLENHDQLANVQNGKRLTQLSNPSFHRAMTLLLLLVPQTPLLFQGQEFGSASPFHFFADHTPEFQKIVWAGRKKFLEQFVSFKSLNPLTDYPDPSNPETFKSSILDWDNRDKEALCFHKTVIQLKKEDPTLFNPKKIDGAIIGTDVLLLRYFGEKGDRLILCNFGKDVKMCSIAEPLFAPPLGTSWKVLLTTEEARFGGTGCPSIDEDPDWILAAYAAYVLTPKTSASS